MATTLRRLRLKRVSLVDTPANEAARVVLFKSAEGEPMDDMEKAVWTAAYVNDLPDSSFAYISPGGEKDEDGKTKPRSLRHLPYKDADGKIDLPHLRNALARLPQTDIPAEAKASAAKKLNAAAQSAGVGEGKAEKGQPTAEDVDVPRFVRCKKCNAQIEKGESKCQKCGTPMDVEKVADGSAEEEDQMDEKLKADLDAALAQVESLTKERDELAKRLETPEEIEKRKLAALPESIRKQLEDQASEIRQMRDAKAESEHIEKARKEMPNVPGKTEDLGRLLKRVKDVVSGEDFDALTTLLKAASAQIEKGKLFREVGKSGESEGEGESPMAQVARLAAEIVQKNSGTSLPDAYSQIFRDHPELYAAYTRSVSVGANADRD